MKIELPKALLWAVFHPFQWLVLDLLSKRKKIDLENLNLIKPIRNDRNESAFKTHLVVGRLLVAVAIVAAVAVVLAAAAFRVAGLGRLRRFVLALLKMNEI